MRVFVDLGSKMASLLAGLRQEGAATEFGERLLQAFASRDASASDLVRALPPHLSARQTEMVEPLTGRELEVLELLAQRLSAKEIAQRLVISDRTVKRHVANIYQKLGVNSRREAVEAANALGMLAARQPFMA